MAARAKRHRRCNRCTIVMLETITLRMPIASRISILGCPVDVLDMDATVERVRRAVETQVALRHSCVSAGKLNRMHREEALRQAVHSSDIISADGAGVLWAAKMLGQVVPPRVTGIALFLRLVRLASNNGWPIFLLGDRERVVAAVADKLRHAYPMLQLAGHHHGFFDDEHAVVTQIRDAKPALIFVAMGTPRQEVFLHMQQHAMHVPFSMGVGGSFSVVANIARRTPPALGDRGLEWLHRLSQDPSRLMRRNIVEHGGFISKVVRARMGLYTSGHD